ncbi:Prophage CP4-57 regulatory [Mesorhizobium prunaredense]|uniref:Prophage CP4-57 regulatory n=1 Tax=Mesorhizobium prunaredense TaxID=1631249 RepID=A0A1R3UZV0_9HYPH|nr:AlpA family phage regulatory protein [Mesorhizobium prunaredense]SIT53161.1 Prophage CP4-57 regulatory [Mesorhizobium prunaredense]
MKLLSTADLKPVKGIRYSRVHINRLVKAGLFPKPVKIGPNCSGFVEEEIDAWLQAKIEERDQEAA